MALDHVRCDYVQRTWKRHFAPRLWGMSPKLREKGMYWHAGKLEFENRSHELFLIRIAPLREMWSGCGRHDETLRSYLLRSKTIGEF